VIINIITFDLGLVCNTELMKTAYHNFYKLFSTYFHTFSNRAYNNNLYSSALFCVLL